MAFVAIPDAIASVILAGVNPTHGFYALMVGTPVGSLFTSSQFMNTGLTAAMMVEVVEAVSDSASRRSPRQELLIAQKLFFIPFEHLSDDAKLRIECVPLRGSHLRGGIRTTSLDESRAFPYVSCFTGSVRAGTL